MAVCPLISCAMSVPVFMCKDCLHAGGAAGFALCYYEIPKCKNNIFITDIPSFLQLSAHIRLVI